MAEVRIRVRPGRQKTDETAVARIARSPRMRRDMLRRATSVAAYVRLRIPMRTGALRASVRIDETRISRTGHAVRVLVGRGVPHARYFIYGTSPHEIRPRRKKWLRFVVGGQVVFAKRVMHPGNGPKGVWILQDAAKFWRD